MHIRARNVEIIITTTSIWTWLKEMFTSGIKVFCELQFLLTALFMVDAFSTRKSIPHGLQYASWCVFVCGLLQGHHQPFQPQDWILRCREPHLPAVWGPGKHNMLFVVVVLNAPQKQVLKPKNPAIGKHCFYYYNCVPSVNVILPLLLTFGK